MNAIVLAAHGCPISCLGPYGNEWIATPNLDRLAAEGVTFDRHYAAHPDPLAARREWWALTPPPPGEKGVIVRASRPAFDAPQHYYARFAEVFDARPDPADESPFSAVYRVLPSALDAITDQSDWLLWIETDRLIPPWFVPTDVFDIYCEDLTDEADPDADPLEPWEDPPTGKFDRNDSAAWELLHRSFATAVTAFDAHLGRLFELFTERGLDRTATWAFTSDFGYPLGEHGIVGPYRPWLYDEFVHLPLIVRHPNAVGAGRRVWRFTQPAELWACLGERPGLPRPTPTAGVNPIPPNSVISVAEIDGHREAALRTDTHALLLPLTDSEDEPRTPQLFEKPDDRWEVNDVRQPNLELADEMEAELRKRIGPSSET